MNKSREQIAKVFFKRGYSPSKELVSELVELIDSNCTDTLDVETIAKIHMAGQYDAGVDPSYSNARTYAVNNIDNLRGTDELRSNGRGSPPYKRERSIPDYILDGQDVRRLKRLSVRLYDGTVMTYDERRQLAAVIEAIIDRAVPNNKPEETWLL